MKRLYLKLVWVVAEYQKSLELLVFSHTSQTSHNKKKQAVPQVPNKARTRCVTGCHGCFPFSQSSLWTNRGESRVVGSLCKRLTLHHWWAFGSRGCADCVFFDENTVSLFLFPLLKDNFLIMCQYCACTTTIMVLNKIYQPTAGQAITKSRNGNGC